MMFFGRTALARANACPAPKLPEPGMGAVKIKSLTIGRYHVRGDFVGRHRVIVQ